VLVLLVFLPSAMAAADASQTGKAAAQAGRPFGLKLGESVTVEAEGLEVGFERLLSDSRCPTGAQCIQEGEAVVRIWLAKAPDQRQTLELGTTPNRAEGTYGAYRIKLVSLEPHPDLKRPTRASDYVATLTVSRS
jgi:hypothetical protein